MKARRTPTGLALIAALGVLLWAVIVVGEPAAAVGTWAQASLTNFGSLAQSTPTFSEIRSVSCATPGNCTAVGNFDKAGGGSELFTVTSANGVWGSAITATFDSGVPATGSSAAGTARDVSCAAPGNCTAVGSFRNFQGGIEAFTMTSTNGVWASAKPANFGAVSVPALGYRYAVVNSVFCSAPGNCVAVGGFRDPASSYVPFTMTSTGGVWADALPVSVPTNVQPVQASSREAYLRSVSCSSHGNCSAHGVFKTSGGLYAYEAFTVNQSNGTWQVISPLTYASPAATGADADAFAGQISCAPNGGCSAVGSYAKANGDYEAIMVSSSNGVWGPAVTPVFGTGVQHPSPNAFLNTVSCPSTGNCAAGGRFRTSQSTNIGFLTFSSNGTWLQAAPITFDAGVQNTTPDSVITSVSCVTAGNCVAVGRFRNSAGGQEAFTVTSANGAWNVANPVVFGQGVPSAGGNAEADLFSVSCASIGNCATVGYVRLAGTGGDYSGYSVSLVDNTPATTTSTTTLAPTTVAPSSTVTAGSTQATTTVAPTTVAPSNLASAGNTQAISMTEPDSSQIPQLPATGSESDHVILAGLMMVVVGLIVTIRRRPSL